MPTLPWSPVRSIHSWSLVYLKPAGYAIASPVTVRLKPDTTFIERHRHDARAGAAAADVDVERRVERRMLDRQIRHADGLLQIRRLRAAGDVADLGVADVGVVAVAADAAIEHLEADDFPLRAARLLLAQRARADKVVFLPAHDPVQVRFHSRRRLVDVVAVEAHTGFEAQRVARTETARDDVGRSAG